MSQLVRKIIGALVADRTDPDAPPLLRWTQAQCRYGVLRPMVDEFCGAQTERLDPALVVVEAAMPDGLVCLIPCRCVDHESLSPFSTEVRFKLDPATGVSRRVGFEVG